MRHTGIEAVGKVPWGTHFCQFYETARDLLDNLVPYFREGLAANESCVWLTSDPLKAEEATAALKKAVPDLDARLRAGQMEIAERAGWGGRAGGSSLGGVPESWVGRLESALAKGYAGLRVSEETDPPGPQEGRSFRDRKEAIEGVIGGRKILALCTCSLRRCGTADVVDAAGRGFALVKRQGRWEVLETSARRQADEASRRAELRYSTFLQITQTGFWLVDMEGRLLEVNDSYCRMSGYRREELLGRRVGELEAGERPEEVREHIRYVRDHGHHQFESRHRRKDGTLFDVDIRSTYVDIEDGREMVFIWDISDKAKMERDLRDSEEKARAQSARLQAVLDGAPALIWATYDRECRSITGNRAAFEFLRVPLGTNMSKTGPVPENLAHYGIFQDGVELAPTQMPIQSVAKSGRAVEDCALEFRFDDGTVRSVLGNVMPIFDSSGRPDGAVGVFIDITERLRAEEALRESEQKYRDLVRSAPAGIYEVDFRTKRFTSVNDAMCELTGYSREELQSMTPFEILDEPSRLLFTKRIDRWLADEEPDENVEYRVLAKDGREIYALLNVNFTRDEKGMPLGATVVGHDITERRRIEEDLRRIQTRLESLIDYANAPIIVWDTGFKITTFNHAFERLTGLKAEKVIGLPLDILFPEPTREESVAHIRRTLAGERWEIVEIPILRADGSVRTVLWNSANVYEKDGVTIAATIAQGQDITERKQAEEELRRSAEDLRRLNRTLTALSHSNRALMRARSEKEFLDEICRIVVEDCGHAMVWVGYAEDDQEKKVRPVAHAGFEKGYLENLRISWADTERGRGPTGTAVRTGKPTACADMLTDPKFAPWREDAIARGYASSLALPLLADGHPFGSITIYFRRPGAVPEDEMGLLLELANDASQGIASLRLREAHGRAEQALRESEERLASFAAATFEGVVLTQEGVIVDCNEQFAEMAGLPVLELRGRPVGEFIAPEDRERVTHNIRSNRESVVEHEMIRPDGSRLTVEVHGRPSGGLRYSAVRDVTDRKRAEQALVQRTDELQQLTRTLEARVRERTAELAEANERLQAEVTHSHFVEDEVRNQKETLQTVIDNIPVMLCFFDARGKAILTNREFQRLLGWSNKEAGGLGILSAGARSEAAGSEAASSAAEAIPGWNEQTLKTRAGDELESSWATIHLPEGGRIGIGIDMSERQAAEADRLRLAAAFEQTHEGMAITDSRGLIRYANQAFEKAAGAERGRLIGLSYFDSLGKTGDGKDLAAEARRVLEHGEPWTARLARKKSDDTERELDVRLTPIRDRSGRVINFLVVERDVTREVLLQQHVRQVQKLEALGTLAGGIAHDFNNILNPIFINTELILMDVGVDDAMKRELEIIMKAAERGRDLVKQIISFSRQKEKERRPSRVGPVVKEALKFLRSSLDPSVEIRQTICQETGFVMADPTQIHQVIMNLANNAAYAMRERGGVLDVSLTEVEADKEMAARQPDLKPGPYLRLTVADTGTGMTREVMERAFDPFFTTKRPGEGSGLGLAVVHGVVRDYGGAVRVTSEPGRGATFDVYFPRVASEEVQQDHIGEGVSGGMERILLVDDEEVQVQSMRNMLRRLGYRVVAKTDPAEALKAFQRNPEHFDLVITDQTMPKLTGAQLAEEILRVKPGVSVILCTGYSDRVDAEGAHAMGIREFLMKPFSMRDIAAAINRAVRKSQT